MDIARSGCKIKFNHKKSRNADITTGDSNHSDYRLLFYPSPSTAQLTLGGMIKNLSTTDRKKADELTDTIIDNMKNSPDTLRQLLVYGNTGS